MTPEEISRLSKEEQEGRVQSVLFSAEQFLPAFRDKFDFSDDKDFDRLADIAVKAAEALQNKREAMLKPFEPKTEVPK